MIKSKKAGGIVPEWLIWMIVLIVSFLILLFIFYRFYLGADIDRTACHESVVLRATLPDSLGLKEVAPLKCKTRKLCLTSNLVLKGECDEFGTSFVNGRIGNTEDEINKAIAREMAECWTMMGEGKVQVFKKDFASSSVVEKCVLCSRIAIDKNLKEKVSSISGLGNYLITHKVPEKEETYWEYLTRGSASQNMFYRGNEWEGSDSLSTNEKAIFFVEFQKSKAAPIIGAFGGAGTGVLIGAGIGSVVPVVGTAVGGGVGLILGSAGGLIGYKTGEEVSNVMGTFEGDVASGIFLVDYNKTEIEKLGCSYFENIS